MRFAASTHIGRRLKNEDSMHVPQSESEAALAIVADGMGGHAAGKRASTLAVEQIVEHVSAQSDTQNDAVSRLRAAIQRANWTIYKNASLEEGCRGMGTTVTLAFLEDEQYIAANIGDSRLYHFDGWSLTQVTQDHSLVAVLVERGEITPAEADTHPQRNIITRALGTAAYEEADYFTRRWERGDILLLCSDGLYGSVPDAQMEEYLRVDMPLEEICQALIERALTNEATDNITVVLVQNTGGNAL